MADPTLPLDVFPLDSDANLLRWGPLYVRTGRDDWTAEPTLDGVWLMDDGEREHLDREDMGHIVVPARGLALDAILRSTAAALGWEVGEDGPAPRLYPIDSAGCAHPEYPVHGVAWILHHGPLWREAQFHDWQSWAAKDGQRPSGGWRQRIPGISTMPYPEAVVAVALAVAGRDTAPTMESDDG